MVVHIETVLRKGPVLPVVVIQCLDSIAALTDTLLDAGCYVMEITLRTPAALAAIEWVATHRPEMCVGAGTIKTAVQVVRAHDVGAQFGVSPGLTDTLHQSVQTVNLTWLPGVATASEVLRATELGYSCLKFFPAQQVGGVPLLAAWASVFETTMFCPTAGIALETAQSYLNLPNVMCVGGSWFVPNRLIETAQWQEIARLTRQAMSLESVL
jgi:2-dehydro-3-deoxyphosphogluconate aldolase/(4S)-4-hydroxy-2-oxoglutarate aldolase